MSIRFRNLFLVALPLLLAGCSHGITGSGIAKTDNRNVAEFRSISNDTVGNVTVTIGEPQSVSISFDDNLIEFVDTSVVAGELRIRMTENFNSQLGLKIQIAVPSIEALKISGVGKIEATGIDSQSLAVEVTGVGGITAAGKVKNLTATLTGVGSANLEDLHAESATVNVSGVGSATVYASQSIDANTSGIGGITVLGNPQDKKTKQSGIGKITINE